MSPTSLAADDWVSRDDMASLIRKSIDTVNRDCGKHQLATQAGPGGRVLVNVGDFLRIGRLRADDLPTASSAAESAEVLRARETVVALRVQVAELTGRLAHCDTLINTLLEQLGTKDKQLAKQADQLTQAIARLGGAR